MKKKLTRDVRLIFDPDIAESIAVRDFIDGEVRRLNISGGWAGYLMQLSTAAMLARQGDHTLVGMLAPGAITARPAVVPSPSPAPPTSEPAVNTDAITARLSSAF